VGLEPDPLSLVITIEELLERKSSGPGLENRDYGRRGSLRLLYDTPLFAKVGANLLTDSGHGVCFVCIIQLNCKWILSQLLQNSSWEVPNLADARSFIII
jgi:hypothetical protein